MLTSVTFEGSAPDSFGREVFIGAVDEFKVYFYEGAEGFTTPIWQGYPSESLALDPDDSDSDGIDDVWEIEHFGTLGRDSSGDFDGDGTTDLLEFWLETDPTDPNSRLSINWNNEHNLVVTPVVEGLIYRCRWSRDLGSNRDTWEVMDTELVDGTFDIPDIDSPELSVDDDGVLFLIIEISPRH